MITHADFDHYGGAQAFADVPILAAERTAATIAEAGRERVAGMQEEMDGYLAELEEQDAPEPERRAGRPDRRRGPGPELAPPTETFTGERDLGGRSAIDVRAAHTASDASSGSPAPRVLLAGRPRRGRLTSEPHATAIRPRTGSRSSTG